MAPEPYQGCVATDVRSLLQLITTVNRCVCVQLYVCECEQKTETNNMP